MNESEMGGTHEKDLRTVGPPFIPDVEAAFLVQAFDDDLCSVEGGAVLGGVLCGALATIAPQNGPLWLVPQSNILISTFTTSAPATSATLSYEKQLSNRGTSSPAHWRRANRAY